MTIHINIKPDVMVYRRHNCSAKHRTFKTFAKCVWPRAEWVEGEGEYALVAYCGVTTVTLWPQAGFAEASARKRMIDSTGCGSDCSFGPQHKIVRLEK